MAAWIGNRFRIFRELSRTRTFVLNYASSKSHSDGRKKWSLHEYRVETASTLRMSSKLPWHRNWNNKATPRATQMTSKWFQSVHIAPRIRSSNRENFTTCA